MKSKPLVANLKKFFSFKMPKIPEGKICDSCHVNKATTVIAPDNMVCGECYHINTAW